MQLNWSYRGLEMQECVAKKGDGIGRKPKGELASRTLAMPADCIPRGHLRRLDHALMDSAGKMSATPHAAGVS